MKKIERRLNRKRFKEFDKLLDDDFWENWKKLKTIYHSKNILHLFNLTIISTSLRYAFPDAIKKFQPSNVCELTPQTFVFLIRFIYVWIVLKIANDLSRFPKKLIKSITLLIKSFFFVTTKKQMLQIISTNHIKISK